MSFTPPPNAQTNEVLHRHNGTTDGDWQTSPNTPSGSYTINWLGNGTEYEVSVRSYYPYPLNARVYAERVIGIPRGKPYNVMAAPGNRQITISWAGIAGADQYNLRARRTETANFITREEIESPYVFTNRTNGVELVLQVGAVFNKDDGTTEVKWSDEVMATPNDGTPASVRVLSGNDKLQLSWSNGAGADSHTVRYREKGPGDWTTVENVNNPHKIEGLVDFTEYELQVGAVSGALISWADAVFGTPNNGVAKNVTVAKGNKRLRVTWTPVLDALSYYVDWRAGGSGDWTQVDLATSPTDLTGLANDTEVCVAVYTRIEGRGNPLRDPVVCATPDDDNRPHNLKVTGGDGEVTASWSPVIGADSYKLRWKKNVSGEDWAPSGGLTAASPTTLGGLDNGAEYCVHVKAAFDDGADSPYNTAVCATPGTVFDGNMRVGKHTGTTGDVFLGYDNFGADTYGELDSDTFTHNGTSYRVTPLYQKPAGDEMWFRTDPDLPSDTTDLKIVWKDKTYTLGTDLTRATSYWHGNDKGLSPSENENVTVDFIDTTTSHTPLWDGTLTVGANSFSEYGFDRAEGVGSLSGGDTFTHGGQSYRIDLMVEAGNIAFDTTPLISETHLDELNFDLHDKTYKGSDFTPQSALGNDFWVQGNKGLNLEAQNGNQVTFKITVAPGTVLGFGGPTNLRAEAGDGTVDLSWEMPDGDGAGGSAQSDGQEPSAEMSYEVAYAVEGLDWSEGGSETVTDMAAEIPGLENGTAYQFRVRALTDGEAGPWSATVTASPAATTPASAESLARQQLQKELARHARALLEDASTVIGQRFPAGSGGGGGGGDALTALASVFGGAGGNACPRQMPLGDCLPQPGVGQPGIGQAGEPWDPERGYQPPMTTEGQGLGTLLQRLQTQNFSLSLNRTLLGETDDAPQPVQLALWGSGGTAFQGSQGQRFVGLDARLGTQWLTGVAVAQGGTAFQPVGGATGGELGSALTTVYPYLRGQRSDTLAVWSLAGWGWGDLPSR